MLKESKYNFELPSFDTLDILELRFLEYRIEL